MTRRTLIIATAAAAALTLGACAATAPQPMSVTDTIAATPALSTLNGLVVKSGLGETLKGAGPYTVFAPTNDAFAAVPAKTMDELSKDPALLKSVLTYHVLAAKVMAANTQTNSNAKTVNGSEVALGKAGTFLTVEDAMVQRADIVATNGVVQVIDRVLMPPKR